MEGRKSLKKGGMHGKKVGIGTSVCLVQTVDVCKNSSNFVGVGTGISLAMTCRSVACVHGWTLLFPTR